MTTVDVRVAEIAARAEAADDGPWIAQSNGQVVDTDWYWPVMGKAENREFIAHAITDIPFLLSEVRRLRSVVEDAEAERNVACPHWAPGTITMRKGCTACESVAKRRAGADHE